MALHRYAQFGFSLTRYVVAECLYVLGNLAPSRVSPILWSAALHFNPQHYAAALNRAVAHANDSARGWSLFLDAIDRIRNPRNVSASDLFLTWIPGIFVRGLIARIMQGPAARLDLQASCDNSLISRSIELAKTHLRVALTGKDSTRAKAALGILKSLQCDDLQTRWHEVELHWMVGDKAATLELAYELVSCGRFTSPTQPLVWAARFIESGELDLADCCLGWACKWVPEESGLWQLLARAANCRGLSEEARKYALRALSLNPQDLGAFLILRSIADGGELPKQRQDLKLTVTAPSELALGASCTVGCRIDAATTDYALFVLPPAGWAVMPEQACFRFDSTGVTEVPLRANRPDRINGGPWRVMFVALCPEGYAVAHSDISVPDPAPGKFLVTITEDHEIHEERGAIPASTLARLLVAKSRFASSLGIPWAHMVETGSALALLEWAAATGNSEWADLHEAAVSHLAEEVAAGNDIQVHLHAFNDPAYAHFPYKVDGCDLKPSLRFLLTSPEARRDWASACPSPASDGAETGPGLNRLQSVLKAVGQVESVGRLGDPDYRAVLWRSGLLDFGASDEERAWSSVALRRAGLLAASDVPKPGSPLSYDIGPAHWANWSRPFDRCPGGQLLQLPIAANVEGDYLMGPDLLIRRARKIARLLRTRDGGIKPGVHLYTLLTHDKFINARLGGDEFRLDSDYGDWPQIRNHVEAWKSAGASIVTARNGVRAVIDDSAHRLTAWLDQETFILSQHDPWAVRYRLS
ncbi:MAG TPA: hypothetical protein VI756_04320, partial [Blastocatellia bacterium]